MNRFFSGVILLLLLFTACKENKTAVVPNVIDSMLLFCESTVWKGDTLYIANFGSSELNPLNGEQKGYIVKYYDGKVEPLIKPDGHLNAPKGMAVKDNLLFIADVGKIVIYNTAEPQNPQIIAISKAQDDDVYINDDLYVNDLFIDGNTLYASVTNTGNIFKITLDNLTQLSSATPVLWTNVTGANGIVIADNVMYVASYPPDNNVTEDNVIYYISDLQNPKPQKLITQPGMYDGLAVSPDNKTLYFTTWKPEIGMVNLTDKSVNYLQHNHSLTGPADMTLKNGYLYVPDLVNSKVVTIKL